MYKRVIVLGASALLLIVMPLQAWGPIRMTGGGGAAGTDPHTGANVVATFGFELHCDPTRGPNNLEINWDGGNHFHLTQLQTISCSTDFQSPAPPPNTAGLDDIFNACGIGEFNGIPGYSICFTLIDHGEPGTNDMAQFFIANQFVELNVPLKVISFGNIQAHKENP